MMRHYCQYEVKVKPELSADFPHPVSCVSGGGAQRRAPAELLGRHHVQSSAEPWKIHLHLPPGLRQRRRPAQEGWKLLQRQPGGGISLWRQEASAHGEAVNYFYVCFFVLCPVLTLIELEVGLPPRVTALISAEIHLSSLKLTFKVILKSILWPNNCTLGTKVPNIYLIISHILIFNIQTEHFYFSECEKYEVK